MADDSPSTSLNLLADDGVLQVTFETILTCDQYTELLATAHTATTVRALDHALRNLGQAWGILMSTRIIPPKRP